VVQRLLPSPLTLLTPPVGPRPSLLLSPLPPLPLLLLLPL